MRRGTLSAPSTGAENDTSLLIVCVDEVDERIDVLRRYRTQKPGRRQVILSCEHIDGSPPIATGLLQELRSRGFNTQWTPFATWISERSIVFSGRNNEGWSLWRQELDDRFSPVGDAEQLTTGTTLDWWPSFATGRLAFVSSHPDINLWSLPADTRTGAVTGVLRRITRGPGITAYPSLSADGRALAFASDRGGNWDIIVKATETGTERVLADGADRQMYASITRDGRRVSYGVVVSQPAVNRPIYVADVAGGGPARLLCKDCNGRPRDWFPDGQHLLIERYGRRNSVAVLDDTTGTQRDLVISDERSVMDPRISPDGRWVAFAAGGRDRGPAVYVAPIPATGSVPESAWLEVDREGHHPAGHQTADWSISFLDPGLDHSLFARAGSILDQELSREMPSKCIGLKEQWCRR